MEPLLQAFQVCSICFAAVAGFGFVLYVLLLVRECITPIRTGSRRVVKSRLRAKTVVYSVDRRPFLAARRVLDTPQPAPAISVSIPMSGES